jgi:hypothetical protein
MKNFIMRLSAVLGIACLWICLTISPASAIFFSPNTDISSLERKSLSVTEQYGQYIIDKAWPAASFFGGLDYKAASVEAGKQLGKGYEIGTTIFYKNVIGQTQTIDLIFYYNLQGKCQDIEIVRYSDIIPPKDLSFERIKRVLEE